MDVFVSDSAFIAAFLVAAPLVVLLRRFFLNPIVMGISLMAGFVSWIYLLSSSHQYEGLFWLVRLGISLWALIPINTILALMLGFIRRKQ